MPQVPALTPRAYGVPTSTTGSAQQSSASNTSSTSGSASSNAATRNTGAASQAGALLDQLSLSKTGIDLSAQGMSDRAGELGNATLDVAQNFLSSFAQQLFGDAANGASVTYDSASLESQSGYAALLQQSAGSTGSSAFAGLSLDESSHFIGKGTLTTADGQSFDFEIEVQYESHTTAVAQSSTDNSASSTDSTGQDSATGLPTVQLPNVSFPGSLDDLFKLLGQQLQTTLPASADGVAGNDSTNASSGSDASIGGTLLLRLRNLLNSNALTGTTASSAADASAQARAKALASAYGDGTPATSPATTAPAPTTASTAVVPAALDPISVTPDDNTQ